MPDTCTYCSHEMGPHVLVAGEDPLRGGIMLCPLEECLCVSTWGVNDGRPPPELVERLLELAVEDEEIRAAMAERLRADG